MESWETGNVPVFFFFFFKLVYVFMGAESLSVFIPITYVRNILLNGFMFDKNNM